MKKIKTKMILGMTLTLIVALVITGVSNLLLNYTSTQKMLAQTMEEMAQLAAQRVGHELEAYTNVAYDTGCVARLTDPAEELSAKQEILDQRAASHGFVGGNILDERGRSIFDGADYSDREYAREALAGRTHISEPTLSKVTGKMSVMVAAPLWKDGVPETRVVGVVYFKPTETFLNDIVNSVRVSDGTSAYMLAADGTIIAHQNADVVERQVNMLETVQADSGTEKLAAMTQEMITGASGSGLYTQGGSQYVLAYAPISGTGGWTIGVTAPQSDFMSGTVQSLVITIILLVVAALIATGISIFLAAGISRPIAACCDRLELLARGDLTSPVPQIKAKDETGRLAQSTNTIVATVGGVIGDVSWGLDELAHGNFSVVCKKEELYQGDYNPILESIKELLGRMNETLGRVRAASDQVSAGSGQVSAGAQALSQGATEQASSVEELAASVVEISGGVKTTARDAIQARDETNDAGRKMGEATGEMQELTAAMGEISRTSGEIGKVIKTIEDIAFQTNILALNAAVEAARAGAAGKGFAVVADEVRNLANKSAAASKGTAELIEDSIRAVEKGNGLVHSTAASMDEVGASAQRVAVMIDAIAKAAQEQAEGLAQITLGIDQISSVVQTNSATAEQSAAASQELSGQSQLLKDLVGQFKLAAAAAQAPDGRAGADGAAGEPVPDGGKY